MKFIKILATCVALGACAVNAIADDLDLFNATRTSVLMNPTVFGAATGQIITMPFDNFGNIGRSVLSVSSLTNTPGGTMTVELDESSTGTNNWIVVTNVATPTSYTMLSSNSIVTSLIASNITLIPGTITTPTAYTAGFAPTYLVPPTYTTAVTNYSITTAGVYQFAFSAADRKRYLRLVFQPGGTVTNITVSAILASQPSSPRLF